MNSKPLRIVIVAAVIVFALTMAKNVIIQSALASGISAAAHVPVSIGSTDMSFMKSSIKVKGLRVRNPRGFKEPLMLDMPLIGIQVDVPALMKGKAHFQEIRLDLKEVVVVKSKDGKLNIDAVKPKEEDKKQQAKAKEE